MPQSPRVPIEAIARYPLPGTVVPGALGFTPDDSLVTYLFSGDGSLTRELYGYDPETGERRRLVDPPEAVAHDDLPLEEQLRRERMRERGLGITRYTWSEEGDRLLVPLAGDLYVQDGVDGDLRRLVEGDVHAVIDPRFSPDGSQLAFVQDAEVYVVATEGSTPRQLTTGARGTGRTHGLAEYIAQEEMGRHRGFWWSDDGGSIAFAEVDETHIPVFRINHSGKAEPVHEDHRYPFAGAANAVVRLGVVPVAGGPPVWMDLTAGGAADPHYLTDVRWLPDGTLVAAVQPRSQQRLDLVRLDPATGRGDILLTERSTVWINLHRIFRPLEQAPGAFLWASERSGFRHLHVVDGQGQPRALTSGDWMVHGVAGVDEDRGLVYFTAGREDPRERHLYAVPLAGGAPRRITREPGMHSVVLDHGFARYLDTFHSPEQPPTTTLRSLEDGGVLGVVHDETDPRVAELALRPPELLELESRDGVALYGALYRPDGEGPWPLLVDVYGGPHAQRVLRSWDLTINLRAQHFREQGFAVLRLDNRGAWGRGLAFEGALRHDMGNIEVADQVDGVRALVARGVADPDHVGIYGWSYGGYMAAMALCRAPDVFHAAVAGAPVTHWDGYDTHYTERYMGTPAENPDGYARSSVMHHVEGMRGALMLVHGMIDENVHFRHTARLVDALIAARKDHVLLPFPNERHMPRREADRVFMEERILEFFKENLSRPPAPDAAPQPPPRG